MREKLQIDSLLHAAAKTYLARHDRVEHPAGGFDRAGRWVPSAIERQDCCECIRTPSRAYPYSLMLHCRSAEHVANLFGVTPRELRRAARYVEATSTALEEGLLDEYLKIEERFTHVEFVT